MPLYMDVHRFGDGVTVDDFAKAHQADLQMQDAFDVKYLRYWVNETEGNAFCLVEAPDLSAASAVHRKAHGLVADQVLEVQEGS
jgi:hypothetical protein